MADVSSRSRSSPEVVRATTSFVGREAELAAAADLLADARLLTLTGAGGIGKTRLALELSADVAPRYRDGVWVVELGGLRAEDDVAEAVVAALGLTSSTTRDALTQLVDELADAELLIVLDNCEHLLTTVRLVVVALLRSTARIDVLAPTREPLGIGGARVIGIAPLRVPAADVVIDADAARAFPAVRLLEDRAVAASSGFTLDDHNLAPIVAIVSRLDGLPLAIELAAVRLRSLSAADLLQRIGDRFAMLNRGNEAALPQHRTLRAMVEWSLDLCTVTERNLWARMSVFAGSADLAAVLAVCDHDVSAGALLDDLDSLVAKSVVSIETVDGSTRYRLLETLAELGREQLAAGGDAETVQGRHATHYRGVAHRGAERFWSRDQAAVSRGLVVERLNLRQAFEHLLEHRVEDGRAALELAADLRTHWVSLSMLREGRRWLETALAAVPDPSPARAWAVYAAMWISVLQTDGDAVARRMAELERTLDTVDEAPLRFRVSMWRGILAVLEGDAADNVDLLDRCAAWFMSTDDPEGAVVTHWVLIIGLAMVGRHDEARAVGERGLRLALDRGEWGQSYMMWGRAHAAWARGDHAEAMAACRRGLATKYDYGDSYGIGLVLGVLSGAYLDSGVPVRAATLLGIASLAFDAVGTGFASLGAGVGAAYQDVVARPRLTLGDAAYRAAHDVGRRMTTEQSRAFVLERPADPAEVAPSTPHPNQNAGEADGLSPREVEVAGLVARGLSNRAVAEELVLSHRTVEGHVERILAKLGFRNRVELAAWVAGGSATAPGSERPGDTLRRDGR